VTFVLAAPVELTPREMEAIQLLAEGLSNKEIARLLSISPRTVNFHLHPRPAPGVGAADRALELTLVK
jgi:FixJ family two-component response regulator